MFNKPNIREQLSANRVEGQIAICRIIDGVWRVQSRQHNTVLYDWAPITSRLLAGHPEYKLGGMYIEFENVAAGVTPSTPTVDRTDGLSYYTDLATSLTRDFLRIPITAASLDTSDAILFPDDNIARFYAIATGTAGVYGKTYNPGSGLVSKVCGAALVAMPVPDDQTQDIVFSRTYLTTPVWIVPASVTGQIGLTWDIKLL